MKSIFVRLLLFGLLAPIFAGGQAGAEGISRLGLQVALTTGGNRFDLDASNGAAAGIRGNPGKAAALRESFPASIAITNLGREDVPFSFPDADSAAARFRFRLFDASGAQIWQSRPEPAATLVPVSSVLRRKSAWRQTIQIPLKVNGQPLPAGRYTLEAMLLDDSHVGALSLFEVVSSVARPDGGIRGWITSYDSPNPERVAAELDSSIFLMGISYAPVTVTEIQLPNARYDHPPFTWSGRAEQDGTFSVATPAGRFQFVTAGNGYTPLTLGAPEFTINGEASNAAATVTVAPGHFTPVNLSLFGPDPSKLVYGPVNSVTSVSASVYYIFYLVYSPNQGPHVSVTATGTVSPSRARYGRLVQRGTGLSADGFMEYDMQASGPIGPAQVVSSVTAHTSFLLPAGYKGVRIFSATNTVSSADGVTP